MDNNIRQWFAGSKQILKIKIIKSCEHLPAVHIVRVLPVAVRFLILTAN